MSDEPADWFERNMASAGTPVTLTEGQRRCLNTLQAVTAPSGLYNLWGPGAVTDVVTLHNDEFVSVLMQRELATFDGSELTALVLAAHRNCVRVAVTTWAPHTDERRARTVAQHIQDVREDDEEIDWEDPQVGYGIYRLNLTARDPESDSNYDRHPGLERLVKAAGADPVFVGESSVDEVSDLVYEADAVSSIDASGMDAYWLFPRTVKP